MIDLGVVIPGRTLRIPFASFDKDDGSSITMTNYAAADILVYKDGSTTERASTAGFTATTDFDAKTGKHLAIIDLADDTTADFFKAGSEYLVAIDAVTVDGVTTGGWIARFRIGYPNAYFDTSIATLASQTSFTLTAGPAEDDALNGMVLIVHDKASAIQMTRVVVEDYTGSTKTVTLRAAPATTFTIAAGDNVSGIGFDKVDVSHVSGTAVTWSATRGLAGTAVPAAAAGAAGGIPLSTAGGLDLDAKIGALTYTVANKVDANISTVVGVTPTVGASLDFPTQIASRTNITGGTITTVTNLTNAPTNGDLTATMKTSVTTASDAVAIKADTAAILLDTAEIGAAGAGLTNINLPNQTMDIVGNITGNLSGSVGSVTGAVGSVTGAVGSVTALAANSVTASALATDAVTELTDAILALVIETGLTLKNCLRLCAAAAAAKISGAATTTVVIRNAVADDKDRITATVDSDGNRSAITLDLT